MTTTFGNPTVPMITFVNPDTEQAVQVRVFDLYPQMGETHIEGRRVVTVSVEMFFYMMEALGYAPVTPDPDKPRLESVDGGKL